MKKSLQTFLFVCVSVLTHTTKAQSQFWQDNFEASPTSGTRTTEENGGTLPLPSIAYFKSTDGTTISQAVAFTGKEGTNYWAGEDHNAAGTGFTASGAQGAATNSASNELQIEWTGINISGKTGISFKGLIAANSTNEPWDNAKACNGDVVTTNTDYIIVQYKIDGGAYTDLIRFYNKGSLTGTGDKYLFEDTNADGCGDGTMLTNVFQEFTKTIPTSGTTMSLKLLVYCEGNNEEWGIDNFRLFSTPACAITATTSQTNVTCNGGTDGSATVIPSGGTTPYTYAWSPVGKTSASISGLSSGTYICTIKDANGCSLEKTFTITQPTALSVAALSQTNVACNGGSTGAASINTPTGGAGGYTYNWTPGNPTGDGTKNVTSLTAGSWTCTVTDANNCTTSQSFTITQPTALSVAALSQTNVACNGGSTGAATINTPTGGTGGYTYNWTPGNPTGDGTKSVTGLTAGSWTCTVTDANNCTTSQTFTITQPTALSVSALSQTNVACNGGSTGAASINTPTGGAGGYTYDWTPGNPTGDGTKSITGLTAGSWTCTVTDANSCTTSQSFTITQPTLLTGNENKTICSGDSVVIGKTVYKKDGQYKINLVAKNGCDSLLILNLNVLAGTKWFLDSDKDGFGNSDSVLVSCTKPKGYTDVEGDNCIKVYNPNQMDSDGDGIGDACVVTGLENTDINSTKIYPNPNTGSVTIEFESLYKPFVILNSLGDIVSKGEISKKVQTLDLSAYPNGIYFLQIEGKNFKMLKY